MEFVSRCVCNALYMLSCSVLLDIVILSSVDMALSPKTIPMRLLEIYIYNNHSKRTTPGVGELKQRQKTQTVPSAGKVFSDDSTNENSSDKFTGPQLTNKVLDGYQQLSDPNQQPPFSEGLGSKNEHNYMEAVNIPGNKQNENYSHDKFVGPSITNKVLEGYLTHQNSNSKSHSPDSKDSKNQHDKDYLHMEAVNMPGNQKENYYLDKFVGPSITNKVLEGYLTHQNSNSNSHSPDSKDSKNQHDKDYLHMEAVNMLGNQKGNISDEFIGPSITNEVLKRPYQMQQDLMSQSQVSGSKNKFVDCIPDEFSGPIITQKLLEKYKVKPQIDPNVKHLPLCSEVLKKNISADQEFINKPNNEQNSEDTAEKTSQENKYAHSGPIITSDLLEKRNIKLLTDKDHDLNYNQNQQSQHERHSSDNHRLQSYHNQNQHSNYYQYPEAVRHVVRNEPKTVGQGYEHHRPAGSLKERGRNGQQNSIQNQYHQSGQRHHIEYSVAHVLKPSCSCMEQVHRGPIITPDLLEKRNIKLQKTGQIEQQPSSHHGYFCSCQNYYKTVHNMQYQSIENHQKPNYIHPQKSTVNQQICPECFQQQSNQKKQEESIHNKCCCQCQDRQKSAQYLEPQLVQQQHKASQFLQKQSSENQQQDPSENRPLDSVLHIEGSTERGPAKPTNNGGQTTQPPLEVTTTRTTGHPVVAITKTVGQSLKPAKEKVQVTKTSAEGEYGSSENDADAPRDINSYVALVEIVFSNGNKSYCTATAIHDHVLISAAHCFHDEADENNGIDFTLTFAIMGSKDLFNEGKEHYILIEKVVVHPKFNGWNSNLALIYTFSGIKSGRLGYTIPVAGDKIYDSPVVSSPLIVASWGRSGKSSATVEPQIDTPVTKLSIARSGRRNRVPREIGKVVEDAEILDSSDKNEFNLQIVFSNNIWDGADTTKFNKKLRKKKNEILFQTGSNTNFRRQIIPKRNLIAQDFIVVDAEMCKNLAGQVKPLKYNITNVKEILCYYSPVNYFTKNDAGAPVIQDGKLLAVTVGAVDSCGKHYGIGIKMSCYCTWIAEHLPAGGDKVNCCTDCCGCRNEKTIFRKSFKRKLKRYPKTSRLQKYY